jgi:hypothetical protein
VEFGAIQSSIAFTHFSSELVNKGYNLFLHQLIRPSHTKQRLLPNHATYGRVNAQYLSKTITRTRSGPFIPSDRRRKRHQPGENLPFDLLRGIRNHVCWCVLRLLQNLEGPQEGEARVAAQAHYGRCGPVCEEERGES